MTAATSRKDPRAGYVDPSKVTACRECGKPRTKGCGWRTFCSSECVHEWRIRSNPGYAAARVFERDKGICASCGRDCIALDEELRRLRRQCGAGTCGVYTLPAADRHQSCAWGRRCGEVGLSVRRRASGKRLWEMDHVVPVVEGGGSCGLDNLRTLCWACHGRVTAELRARLAERRRGERAASDPQLKLGGES